MSYYERLRPFDKTRRDPEGHYRCKQCKAILSGRRKAYCSDECEIAYLIPRIWEVAVRNVLWRDNRICALCGFDAKKAARRFYDLKQRYLLRKDASAIEERDALIAEMNTQGFCIAPGSWSVSDGQLWQVDHILPVIEGGGGCGLSNLRTLCTPCHKRETAKLARRRAQRGEPEPFAQMEMELR